MDPFSTEIVLPGSKLEVFPEVTTYSHTLTSGTPDSSCWWQGWLDSTGIEMFPCHWDFLRGCRALSLVGIRSERAHQGR